MSALDPNAERCPYCESRNVRPALAPDEGTHVCLQCRNAYDPVTRGPATWPLSEPARPCDQPSAAPAPSLAGVEVVEVPLAAFFAACDLLRDLLDAAELVGERCSLCHEDEGHDEDCTVGRARTVRAALDYTDPEAQARALELLGPSTQARVRHAVLLQRHGAGRVASCIDCHLGRHDQCSIPEFCVCSDTHGKAASAGAGAA